MNIVESQESSENPEQSTAIEQTDDEAFAQLEKEREIENWLSNFSKRSAQDHNSHYEFQIKQCGEQEIKVQGGDEEIWADGVDLEKGELLEAKYIKNPADSPYISTSKCPDFIRKKAIREVENEFRRYEAVIHDPATPVHSLQVIVNIEEAIPFFTDLLNKFNIPGSVVVKS